MRQTLRLLFDVELFNIEELKEARSAAENSNREIYSWKTTENANWLERGVSNVDVLGLVALPKELPVRIEMPDDDDAD